METSRFTLFELNEHIRRIMALNFTESIWISCELAQVSISRGHRYLSLIQKDEPDPILGDEGQIIARSNAIIWARDYQLLKKKLGNTIENLLQPGLEILIKAKVVFHECYSLSLHITDMDPAYTVGKLALQRQAVMERLAAKGLFEKNKALPMPSVVQRVAVISSRTAAGLQDFQEQLKHNAFGYHIHSELFDAAMQGERVRLEVSRSIKEINRRYKEFDCVALIRGGGSKMDLIAFDEEELCVALANCKLPLFTGIGHEIDESIADIVAYQSLKTPTAVAEWIIQYNADFEGEVVQRANYITTLANDRIHAEKIDLERIQQQIPLLAKAKISLQKKMLEYIAGELPKNGKRIVSSAQVRLAHQEKMLAILRPEEILKRGYSITQKDGKIVKKEDLLPEDTIETTFSDGTIKSKILK